MTRRGIVVLAVLAVGSVLGLVVATNAWFITVSQTPPGEVNSALVRYLPEAGERSLSSLLTYGNLISGSGVDLDGVPLILPGDRLLSSATADSAGNQTVRTSIARKFDTGATGAGETVDTVIYWEVRQVDGAEVVRKQRDLMDAKAPVDQWWENGNPLPPGSAPSPNATLYDIVTTNERTVTEDTTQTATSTGKTTTTTTVTTTYTPRPTAPENTPAYKRVVNTVKVVDHERASYTPTTYTDAAWAALPSPTQYIKATETVLFVQNETDLKGLPTRSYLIIEHIGAGAAATEAGKSTAIPLALGNLSTVASSVRVGINVRLTTGTGDSSKTISLNLAGPDPAKPGTYYLGTTTEGYFVELVELRPYADKDGKYTWTEVEEKTDATSPWGLWDLTVKDDKGQATTAVPPAAPEPKQVKYIVTDQFGIVSNPSGMAGSAPLDKFEGLFNKLYCDNTPVITVHLSYYARQNEFMGWNEFYSQDIDLDMSQYES